MNHVLPFHYRVERAMLLNGMYVYEEYRKQGYGAELVKTAVEHGRQIGIKLVSSMGVAGCFQGVFKQGRGSGAAIFSFQETEFKDFKGDL